MFVFKFESYNLHRFRFFDQAKSNVDVKEKKNMKVFKYWVTEKVRMDVYGEIKEITIYGGSNVSTDDAAQKARQKADLIKRKIDLKR